MGELSLYLGESNTSTPKLPLSNNPSPGPRAILGERRNHAYK